MRLTVYFDGSCLHGKDGAGAAVAYDEDGVEVGRRATFIEGPRTTVNVAEYQGLSDALDLAITLGADDVVVYGDSELIVRHFNGVYACRKEHLQPLLAKVRFKANRIPSVRVREIPRSGKENRRRNGNTAADSLASQCRRSRQDVR